MWSTASNARIHFKQAFTVISMTSTIYSLRRKLNPGDGLMTAKQFFTVPEIEAAVALLDMAGAQIDALADKNISNQIRLAAECI